MARVLRQTTVARDGMHNAFTDLTFWQDCYWVSYRKGNSHASPEGEACLSVSVDRQRFREAARVKVPGDVRDPKTIAIDEGRLAMYFVSSLRNADKERHWQQYMTFSNDGFNWETPQQVYDPHWMLWRIVQHNGRFYSAAYGYIDNTPDQSKPRSLDFVVSDDLLHWEVLSHVEEVVGSETALHFHQDGEVWLVTRNNTVGGAPAYLSMAQPPYTSWETKLLNEMVHAPVILGHEGKLFVAGRRDALHDGPHFAFRTANLEAQYTASLGIWELTRERLQPVLNIPACGDCAYPGFIKDPQGRICLSYYSEHAYRMGVLPERYRQSLDGSDKWERINQNDVFFAEIELP